MRTSIEINRSNQFTQLNLQTMYLRIFSDYDSAFDWMQFKNKACKKAGNLNDTYCVVSHPDENLPYAVVDIDTAIDLGDVYLFSYSGYISNPF